jgi:hypothetical protein
MHVGRLLGPLAFLLIAAGTTYLEARATRDWLALAGRIRRHQPAEVAVGREVHVVGEVVARELTSSSRGTACAAWSERASVPRRTKGKSSTMLVCQKRAARPFGVRIEGGEVLELDPALIPLKLTAFALHGPPPASCPQAIAGGAWQEACLRSGDRIDAYACRDGDRLVRCGDRLDQAESPPGEGPMASLRRTMLFAYFVGAIFLAGSLTMLALFVDGYVVRLRPAAELPRVPEGDE